jgi:iron uptake system component EfeO
MTRGLFFLSLMAALALSALGLRASVAASGPVPSPEPPSPLETAAENYRPLMIDEIDSALNGAKKLNACVKAQDVKCAQKAWIDARIGWERAEVFTAGFVSELDREIDAWPDALTGFHAIEARLFGANSVDFGDQMKALLINLADLDVKIRYTPLTAQGLYNGTARLVYEVGESKADGGESRFSGTSLDDMRNNVEGIDIAYKKIFASTLKSADANLAATVQTKIDEMKTLLAVPDLKSLDSDKLRARSEELILTLQSAAPKLGLLTPTLEVLLQ